MAVFTSETERIFKTLRTLVFFFFIFADLDNSEVQLFFLETPLGVSVGLDQLTDAVFFLIIIFFNRNKEEKKNPKFCYFL